MKNFLFVLFISLSIISCYHPDSENTIQLSVIETDSIVPFQYDYKKGSSKISKIYGINKSTVCYYYKSDSTPVVLNLNPNSDSCTLVFKYRDDSQNDTISLNYKRNFFYSRSDRNYKIQIDSLNILSSTFSAAKTNQNYNESQLFIIY